MNPTSFSPECQRGRYEFVMEYSPDGLELSLGSWTLVTGGGLPVPVAVRLGRSSDGRPIITGMILGDQAPAEITSDLLRSIRIGALLAQMFEDYDPDSPPTWSDLSEESGPDSSILETKARGPSDKDLHEFARVYRRERVRNPRRAVTATAEALHISRATANRRREECRVRGYLPKEGQE